MRQPAFRALADLLIEPPVGEYAIMAYGAYEPIIEVGYQAARQALAEWRVGHEAEEPAARSANDGVSSGPAGNA
jgi:predicted acylesterase/phospholipase RssA